jgi:CRISPR-associated protein Cas2
MNSFLISYDITSNKLRRKIDNVLSDYGIRMQYSLFECNIDKVQLSELRERLLQILCKFENLKTKTDSVVIIGGFKPCDFEFLTGVSVIGQKFLFI